MKVIQVSEQERAALIAHLEEGRSLATATANGYPCTEEKLAWIHKLAGLLHTVNPLVSSLSRDVLGRLFSDLRGTISSLSLAGGKGPASDPAVNQAFFAAFGGLEGFLDGLALRPGIVIDESEAATAINPYN